MKSTARARRILVVDDEEGILRMFKAVLGGYGYATEEARDARSAFDLLGRQGFDVVISDINMPGIDGLAFLTAVRDRDPHLPVILMTGRPSEDSSRRAQREGAFRYVIKPVMPAVLRETVERAIVARDLSRAPDVSSSPANREGEAGDAGARLERAIATAWVAYRPIVSCAKRSVIAYSTRVCSSEPAFESSGALFDGAQCAGRLDHLLRTVRNRAAQAPPGDAKLVIEMPASQLGDPELCDTASTLGQMAGRVVLDITERATLDGLTDLPLRIASLRATGFAIGVGSVGVGFADFGCFARVRPDWGRLDASFVHDIHRRPHKQRIASTLAHLCADQGIVLIADGVNSWDDHRALIDLGIDGHEGDLFGKPERRFAAPRWHEFREESPRH
jgi:EAL domain-containing protein (putative c-di-GMP-specific phosphodiesterase class I)/CheY-like chemotaxis protein